MQTRWEDPIRNPHSAFPQPVRIRRGAYITPIRRMLVVIVIVSILVGAPFVLLLGRVDKSPANECESDDRNQAVLKSAIAGSKPNTASSH